MCPTCVLTIGGGLLLANKLGVNNLFMIGLFTVILSLVIDVLLRKINHGKVFFPYQRVIIPILLLFITIAIAKFLL
ncbi:MAG: hypothetical protein WC894_03490 [Patescibacteria group bacterium]